MITKNNYSQYEYLTSRHLTLSDFGFKKIKNYFNVKTFNDKINSNMLLNFTESTYNYAKIIFPKYSSSYSKHKYTQPALFTILALKIYLKTTYREIIDFIESSDKIKKFLKLKTVPNHSTIQKFFKRVTESKIKNLNDFILSNVEIESELIAMDGTGHTSDYADYYYAKIRGKQRKSYIKNHITTDLNSLLILHYGVKKGPKHDTKFAIPALRAIKEYKPHYILADRAYDSEEIRKCINEEIDAFDQIPLKKRCKKGKYRMNSQAIHRPKIYRNRVKVEGVISVIKRKFSGTSFSRATKLQIKETKLKNVLYNIYRLIQIK